MTAVTDGSDEFSFVFNAEIVGVDESIIRVPEAFTVTTF